MVSMSSATHEYSARLEDALERRGNPLSVDVLLEILHEASETTAEALSAGEREFLLASTDLVEDDLTPEGRARSADVAALDRARAEQEAWASSLTTAEVAALLGRKGASIRRSKAAGDLFALPTSAGRSARFPAWQFDDGRVMPGLREIIPAFPRYTHPLSIQRFMMSPAEELEGLSPVRWLLRGGAVDAVVSLVDERDRL